MNESRSRLLEQDLLAVGDELPLFTKKRLQEQIKRKCYGQLEPWNGKGQSLINSKKVNQRVNKHRPLEFSSSRHRKFLPDQQFQNLETLVHPHVINLKPSLTYGPTAKRYNRNNYKTARSFQRVSPSPEQHSYFDAKPYSRVVQYSKNPQYKSRIKARTISTVHKSSLLITSQEGNPEKDLTCSIMTTIDFKKDIPACFNLTNPKWNNLQTILRLKERIRKRNHKKVAQTKSVTLQRSLEAEFSSFKITHPSCTLKERISRAKTHKKPYFQRFFHY